MSEITIFALALLTVPVFARFARVPTATRKIYHLIGLAGLFLMLGEATRIAAKKIGLLATFFPAVDMVTTIVAFLAVMAGTVWVSYHYVTHMKEA